MAIPDREAANEPRQNAWSIDEQGRGRKHTSKQIRSSATFLNISEAAVDEGREDECFFDKTKDEAANVTSNFSL
jgi:hypothetical protein